MGNSTDDQPGRVASDRSIATPESRLAALKADNTRRDALARNLCARICSEQRTTDDLDQLDAMLRVLENVDELDRSTLIGRLFNDRYDENEGSETEQLYRRAYNSGKRDATALVQVYLGEFDPRIVRSLRELRDSETYSPRATPISLDDIDDRDIDAHFDDSDSDAPNPRQPFDVGGEG